MIFKDGIYEHKNGIKVRVENGELYILSTEIPLAVRTTQILNDKLWRRLDDGD